MLRPRNVARTLCPRSTKHAHARAGESASRPGKPPALAGGGFNAFALLGRDNLGLASRLMWRDAGWMPKHALLEVAMAKYDIEQKLTASARGSPTEVFAALAAYNPQRDLGLFAAFLLHDVPAILSARDAAHARSLSRLGPLGRSAMAFRPPTEHEAGELLLGFIGKFWLPVRPIAMPSLDQFCAWETVGVTKVVWGFSVRAEQQSHSTLECTMRAKSTSLGQRLAFGTYWRLVEHVSAALRTRMLHGVALVAESA